MYQEDHTVTVIKHMKAQIEDAERARNAARDLEYNRNRLLVSGALNIAPMDRKAEIEAANNLSDAYVDAVFDLQTSAFRSSLAAIEAHASAPPAPLYRLVQVSEAITRVEGKIQEIENITEGLGPKFPEEVKDMMRRVLETTVTGMFREQLEDLRSQQSELQAEMIAASEDEARRAAAE